MDDNIRGSSVHGEGAVGFDMGGGVALKARDDSFTSELAPRFNLRRFQIGENLDADEYSVAFNNSLIGSAHSLGLDFSYGRDSTLTTESTDSGLRNDVTDRDSITLQPKFAWVLSQNTVISSSFLFNDVSYLDAEATGYVDYKYYQVSLGVTHEWNEEVGFFANSYLSEFKVPEDESKTTGYSVTGGVNWKPLIDWAFTGAIGWNYSDIEFVRRTFGVVIDPLPRIALISTPASAFSQGPIANVAITKKFDLAEARLDYSRQVSPSGRGAQSTADRIALTLDRQLTENLQASFVGYTEMRTVQEEESIGLFNSRIRDLNRDYSELRGIVRYKWSETISLVGTYRFSHRKNTNQNSSDTADVNTLYFSIEYSGLPRDISWR